MRHREKSGIRRQLQKVRGIVEPDRVYAVWTSRWSFRFPKLLPARDLNLCTLRKVNGVSMLVQYGLLIDSRTGIVRLGPETTASAYNTSMSLVQRGCPGFLDKHNDAIAAWAARKVALGADRAESTLGLRLPQLYYGWEVPVPVRETDGLRSLAAIRFNLDDGVAATPEQLEMLWKEIEETIKFANGQLYFLYPSAYIVGSPGQLPALPPGFQVFAFPDEVLAGEDMPNPAHHVLDEAKLLPCSRQALNGDPAMQEEVKRRFEALPVRQQGELAEKLRTKLQDADAPTLVDLKNALMSPHRNFTASEEPRLTYLPVASLVGAAAPGWDIDLLTPGEPAARLLRRPTVATGRKQVG